ncbi:histidine kinase (plasmid) [Burkholderia savannae]|uniref:histidine kinase n=1 Tax=Burkholderia savannae TaxID=1637837 RepID=A0ABR5T8E9_9BURK|nr:histidine kinase [Burkholderia savannae]KWZ39571.1 histidine kinase [Burkholderia savannae]
MRHTILVTLFYTSCIVLLAAFAVSVYRAIRGSETAKYFLWVWAAMLIVAMPFIKRTAEIPSGMIVLLLLFFLYAITLANRKHRQQVDITHEEMRRVLAESNRRIDEERRILARRLHDEVNPNLLLAKNTLSRLEPLVNDDERAAALLANATAMLSEAYTHMRDIIRNTRIEVIDSIGFTAALESLVSHYATFSDKPVITLEHNLPKRPELDEDAAVSAYKIVREAIFNAIKHANATQVRVKVDYNQARNLYSIEVVDDGVGVKVQPRAADDVGIGLIDMRERVWALGGTLKVEHATSTRSKRPGTRVSFSFSSRSS